MKVGAAGVIRQPDVPGGGEPVRAGLVNLLGLRGSFGGGERELGGRV